MAGIKHTDFPPTTLNAKSSVEMEPEGGNFKVSGIKLTVEGHVPDVSAEQFDQLASEAKTICPISRA